MSVDLKKPLTKEGSLEIVNAFAHVFASAGMGGSCLAADKLEKWLRGMTITDLSRPFRRGDKVNVLSIERGKVFKENVLVMDESLSEFNGRTYVTVTMEPGMSIEEANRRCLFSEFDYTRIVLVEPAPEDSQQETITQPTTGQ